MQLEEGCGQTGYILFDIKKCRIIKNKNCSEIIPQIIESIKREQDTASNRCKYQVFLLRG
jgi:hypothetical protein